MGGMSNKPRLSQGAWQLVLKLHDPRAAHNSPILASVRNELISLDLLCYSEGWKLTRRGKELARYLTGRK